VAWRRWGAELLGTLLLVFVEAGANTVDGMTHGSIGHVARYLSDGLMVVALIYALEGVSGAHINPCVTLAFALRRDLGWRDAAGYWCAQLTGAALGAGLLLAFFGANVAYGVTQPGAGFSRLVAVAMETVLTFILIFVILSTVEEKAVVGKNGAIAIGFTVALCGLVASPVSGASMNPARSFGPALASGHWSDLWLYFAGPAAGAVLATVAAAVIHKDATQTVFGPALRRLIPDQRRKQ